jgi:hypothetical protein
MPRLEVTTKTRGETHRARIRTGIGLRKPPWMVIGAQFYQGFPSRVNEL